MVGFLGCGLQSGHSAFLPHHDIRERVAGLHNRSFEDEPTSEVGKRGKGRERLIVGRSVYQIGRLFWSVNAHRSREARHLSGRNAVKRVQHYGRTMRSAGIDLEALCRDP